MRRVATPTLALGLLFGLIQAPARDDEAIAIMFHNPQWSPDGAWLLFDSNLSGQPEIYAIRRDGTGLRALTESAEAEGGSLWAQDGRAITYTVGVAGHGTRYRLALDAEMRRAGTPEPVEDETSSVVSADGTHELFTRSPAGQRQQVFVRHADSVVQLSRGGDHAEQPSFSPDGQWIVYEIRPDAPPFEYVVLVRPDGSERRVLSVGSDPSWAPDGQHILFKAAPEGSEDHEIVTLRPDGTARRTHGRGAHPEWSPDGTEISWMAERADGGTDIWIASFAGGTRSCVTCGLRNRTRAPTSALSLDDKLARWRVEGRRHDADGTPDRAADSPSARPTRAQASCEPPGSRASIASSRRSICSSLCRMRTCVRLASMPTGLSSLWIVASRRSLSVSGISTVPSSVTPNRLGRKRI